MQSQQTTYRRFGVEVYIEKKTKRKKYTEDNDDDGEENQSAASGDGGDEEKVIVHTKGFRLSVNPFFFKNRVDFQQLTSPKVISAANTTNQSTGSTTQTYVLTEDAGIPKPLNDTIFDIFSRAQHLSSLQHENLCQFITAQPSQKHHDQMLVVSEDYQNSLKSVIDNCIKEKKYIESYQLGLYCYQILKALCYLHSNRITHRNLSIENIKLNQDNQIKLVNYGLYHLSNEGENVSFPIGNLLNLSPESILQSDIIKGSSNPKCDIWALGCILLESSLTYCLWNDRDPATSLNRIMYIANLPSNQQFNTTTLKFEGDSSPSSTKYSLLPTVEMELESNGTIDEDNNSNNNRLFNIFNILDQLEMNQDNGFGQLDQGLKDVIRYCLNPSLRYRPSSKDLLDHPYFNQFKSIDPYALEWVEKPCVKSLLLPDDLSVLLQNQNKEGGGGGGGGEDVKREQYDIYSPLEIFYLWKLSGGDLEKELVKQGLATPSPSVHKLPLFVPLLNTTISGDNVQEMMRLDKESKGVLPSAIQKSNGIIHSRSTSVLYNADSCSISIDSLIPRFKKAYQTSDSLLAVVEQSGVESGFIFSGTIKTKKRRKLESNIEYQIIRLREFHYSLYKYQYGDPTQSQPLIIRQAKFGIPSILRGDIWAAILGVNDTETGSLFRSINLDQKGPNDKQFEVDIPRCHQYHPLLSSQSGHHQLFRVLKAWSLLNIDRGCYWQGMDNVASPFVVHNFRNDARAFGCLKSFVDKYLKILYVPNNFVALNEMMLIYQQLLSYHDPELSVHLHNVQLEPNLYAIPWFITIFSHLLPIDKIDTLWDTILLGPSSLPYFFAVSIMTQFRSILIGGNLETCIKSLSRIPACDIDRCVDDSLDRFNNTPLSTTLTKFVAGADDDLWWMQEVPLEDRKKEMFPRINIHDLINMHSEQLLLLQQLGDEKKKKNSLAKSNSINNNNNNKNNTATTEKSKIVKILDIRPSQQYQQCYFPQSININVSLALQQQPSSNKTKLLQQLEQYKGSPIVVISSKSQKDEEVEFCNTLVKSKFPYVSLLNGGIDALEHGAQSILISNNNNDTNTSGGGGGSGMTSARNDDRSLSDRGSFRD